MSLINYTFSLHRMVYRKKKKKKKTPFIMTSSPTPAGKITTPSSYTTHIANAEFLYYPPAAQQYLLYIPTWGAGMRLLAAAHPLACPFLSTPPRLTANCSIPLAWRHSQLHGVANFIYFPSRPSACLPHTSATPCSQLSFSLTVGWFNTPHLSLVPF
jgi:hypothetical protein